MSWKAFFGGVLAGAAATAAAGRLLRRTLAPEPIAPAVSEPYVHSYWLESAGFYERPPSRPLLESRTSADIVIVGGGYTGLSAAWHLAERLPAKRIVLLEAARCGYGASGRSGGQALATNLNFAGLSDEWVAAGRRLSLAGLEILRELAQRHRLSFDLRPAEYLIAATEDRQQASLEETARTLEAAGVRPRRLDEGQVRDELGADAFVAALAYDDGSAALHPGRLALGLKGLAESRGVEIYEQTRVVRFSAGGTVEVETEFGAVRAPVAILATNAYTHLIGFFQRAYFPLVTSIVATEPADPARLEAAGLRPNRMLVTAERSLHYLQVTPDGRLILGGGGAAHPYGGRVDGGNHKAQLARLPGFLRRVWPELGRLPVSHGWSGVICYTRDGLPSLGRLQDAPNVFYALGYSGEGIAAALAAGKVLAGLVAGEAADPELSVILNRPLPYVPPEPVRSVAFAARRLWR